MKCIQIFTSFSLGISLLASCNNVPTSNKNNDTVNNKTDTVTLVSNMDSSAIVSFAIDSILTPIKLADLIKCAAFIDESKSLLLSPYGSLDTTKNIKLSPAQFKSLLNNNKKMRWGFADGTGDPIDLTLSDYFKKFVYDVDFINAEKISVNQVIDPDPGLNKIELSYPYASYVQFYFSGFKTEYDGMDWRSLTLIFKNRGTKLYLVAIVHDQWKI